MPAESQMLYFHMVIRADDDGIVESYPLLKLLGVAPDTFKVLVAKGFLRQLNEDQVVVITDWLEHNSIRADRKVDSIYKGLLLEVAPDIRLIEAKPRIDVEDNSRRVGGLSTDGISQVKLGKGNKNAADAAPFSLSEEIKKLEESPRRDLNVIALYLEQRKPDLRTREQFNVALRRHLRPAKLLSPFNDDQILRAVGKVKHEFPGWTIETLVKMATK